LRNFDRTYITDGATVPERLAHHAPKEINALGVHIKDAVETINQLEGLGLQKMRIPLPKIIVLG
jgi:hypothetical protein